jgi:hypothetical protein
MVQYRLTDSRNGGKLRSVSCLARSRAKFVLGSKTFSISVLQWEVLSLVRSQATFGTPLKQIGPIVG